MNSLFSEKLQKTPPKNLDECIEEDGVANSIWIWAQRLKRLGNVIWGMIIVLGIIHSTYQGISSYAEISLFDGDLGISAGIFSGIIHLFIYALIAVIEYFLAHAIVLHLSGLARDIQNTSVSINLELYSAKGKYGHKFTEKGNTPVEPKNKITSSSDENSVTEADYFDVTCPYCGQTLSFPTGIHNAVCPWCNQSIKLP